MLTRHLVLGRRQIDYVLIINRNKSRLTSAFGVSGPRAIPR